MIASDSLAAASGLSLAFSFIGSGSAIAIDSVTFGPSGTCLAISLASDGWRPITRHTSRTRPRALRLWNVAIWPTRAAP